MVNSSRLFIVSLLFCLLVTMARTTHAELIVMNFENTGDGLLTLDTNTGLKWLDPNKTAGLSMNAITSSDWYNVDGFEHATTNETLQLLTNAGWDGNSSGTDMTWVDTLYNSWGYTALWNNTNPAQRDSYALTAK